MPEALIHIWITWALSQMAGQVSGCHSRFPFVPMVLQAHLMEMCVTNLNAKVEAHPLVLYWRQT
jgi:hypothetical protein